jgi:hypothetical protein
MASRSKPVETVKSYSFEDTSDENIKRFVDVDGNWTHYWFVKEQVFVKAVTHILGLGYSKGPRFNQYLLSITKDEQQKVLTEAGDRGSRVHKAIEDLISGVKLTMESKYPSEVSGRQEVLSMREWKCLMAWVRWATDYNFRVVAHDKTVGSVAHKFAGTLDALGVITVMSGDKVFPKALWGKDVLLLPDWKTSAGIWDEYKAQVASYVEAVLESKKYQEFFSAYPVFTGIVRIGTKHAKGYEMEVWDLKTSQQVHFKRLFLGAQAIADDREPEFKPEIEEVPTEILIKVPQAKAPAKVTKARKAKTKK